MSSEPPSAESVTGDVRQIYEETHADLIRLGGLLTGSNEQAADIVADAFVGLIAALQSGPLANPYAYLRRSVTNSAIGRYRKAATQDRHLHKVAAKRVEPDFSGTVAQSETLWSSLLQLSAKQRAILVLRFYEDLPVEEVAQLLDIPAGTVKSITSRVLKQLQQHELEAHDD